MQIRHNVDTLLMRVRRSVRSQWLNVGVYDRFSKGREKGILIEEK